MIHATEKRSNNIDLAKIKKQKIRVLSLYFKKVEKVIFVTKLLWIKILG